MSLTWFKPPRTWLLTTLISGASRSFSSQKCGTKMWSKKKHPLESNPKKNLHEKLWPIYLSSKTIIERFTLEFSKSSNVWPSRLGDPHRFLGCAQTSAVSRHKMWMSLISKYWLVVDLPLWKISYNQLGWWTFPIYGKVIQKFHGSSHHQPENGWWWILGCYETYVACWRFWPWLVIPSSWIMIIPNVFR